MPDAVTVGKIAGVAIGGVVGAAAGLVVGVIGTAIAPRVDNIIVPTLLGGVVGGAYLGFKTPDVFLNIKSDFFW
jgi:hypothetical protein